MFKQGDRVKIRSNSVYHYQSDNTEGEIYNINLNGYEGYIYEVKFKNGTKNDYREIDLELIQSVELTINLW